jgi:hypothetical protein
VLPQFVRDCFEYIEWKPVSRPALILWLVFYAWFLAYAFRAHGEFLFIDRANLVMHEAGHAFFGYFGQTIGVLGGTLGELIVPALLAFTFAAQGHTTGVAFCAFFFFENFLYIATYMADARALDLPLVSLGGGDGEAIHDWNWLFTHWGVLQHDVQIAGFFRALGWLGMVAVCAWLAHRSMAAGQDGAQAAAA